MKIIKEINNYRKRYGSNLGRALITGLDNSLTYLYNKTPSRGPLIIGWDVTFKCNARCSFCDFWRKGLETKNELTTDECLKIIREAGKNKTWALSLTGGEPLIRQDLPLLIKEAKKHKINVNINTNGSLLVKRAKEIVDSGLDSITISIDSHLPGVHNKLRGFPGLFELAEQGIKKIKELRKNKKPHIAVRITLSKTNYKTFGDFIEYWKDKVDSISAQPLYEGTSSSLFHIKDKDMILDEQDQEDFKSYLKELSKRYKWLNNTYYKEFPNFFFNKDHLMKKYKCHTSFFYIVIDPHGNTFPCAMFVSRFGNLRDNSLMDIWKGKHISDFRKILKNKQYSCFCWSTDWITSVYLSKIFR